MKIFSGPEVPTPFGKIKLPDMETPPVKLPTKPDERGKKAIGHGLGEDLAQIPGLIPWIGAIVGDLLEDTHHAEIRKILTPGEYAKFTDYNKSLPTTLALIRALCYKEI